MDCLFMMIALYCITKLKMYCKLASELTGIDEEINDLAKKHLKLIEFIAVANSALEYSILFQLSTALGLFVFGSFQVRHGFDYCVGIMFIAVMIQLFLYCLLSELIYTMVS